MVQKEQKLKEKKKPESKHKEDEASLSKLTENIPLTEEILKSSEIEESEKEIVTEVAKTNIEKWAPKTEIGRKVKAGEIKGIDELLDYGKRILEVEVVDALLPNLEKDLLMIGQSKGKFGGGKRRVFKQTQKKTKEGNKPKFSTAAIVGDKNGHIGIGFGKAKETVPAREKAFRNAKLNIFKIRRGSGDWESEVTGVSTSIPFKVTGKCGSVSITLIPAPKGTGLCIEKECGKILKLAGINDIWSRTIGQTGSKLNLIKACEEALKKLTKVKVQKRYYGELGLVEGSIENSIRQQEA